SSHVVAEFFVIDETLRAAGNQAFERIKTHLARVFTYYFKEWLPVIAGRIMKVPTASQSAAKLAEFRNLSKSDLLDSRRYHSTFFVFRMMVENEEYAL
ncbi:hypothetical protein PMAYCL1PPCAC_09889, partial [Pristionchus mayeri]